MLHSAIHKYRHALGQLVPLLGCTVIGHSQGELAKGTEKNKLSGQPCCINEGDGKTWQPNHVNHGLLEGLQSLNWLISRRGANPIWQDMAPTPRERERLTSPRTLPCASPCMCTWENVLRREAERSFVFLFSVMCMKMWKCVFACDNSAALLYARGETTPAEWLAWKLKLSNELQREGSCASTA